MKSELVKTHLGLINKNWKLVTFEKIIQNLQNGIYKSKEFQGKGTKIIKMGIQFNNPRIRNQEMDRLDLSDEEQKKFKLHYNDLLFARRSLVFEGAGKCSIIKETKQPLVFESSLIRITLKKDLADPDFYFYFFQSPLGKQLIYSIKRQTSVSGITGSDLKKQLIPLPSLNIQKQIGKIFTRIDDKIKNLQEQNKKIHHIIQAIFKSWFIDFDGQTEFVDSALGKIPKDWNVKKIEQVCDTYGGGTPSTKNSEYWNGDINWAIPSDVTKSDEFFLSKTEKKITQKGFENCSSKLHPENSILMTSRATIGCFSINHVPLATNQGFIIIETKKPHQLYYLLNNFQRRVSEFIDQANGTTFLEISRGTFRKLLILIPPEKLLYDFHAKAEPIYKLISINEKEIQNFKISRGFLLQHLMSGEIQV